MPILAKAFARVTFLDTSLFMKTKSRQRAVLQTPGMVSWQPSPTEVAETVDKLLAENWRTLAAAYEGVVSLAQPTLQAPE